MGRPPRFYPSGFHYHVISRCNNKSFRLVDDEDFLQYLATLRFVQRKHKFKIFNYELMNSHVHLFLEPGPQIPFSKTMFLINWKYSYDRHVTGTCRSPASSRRGPSFPRRITARAPCRWGDSARSTPDSSPRSPASSMFATSTSPRRSRRRPRARPTERTGTTSFTQRAQVSRVSRPSSTAC